MISFGGVEVIHDVIQYQAAVLGGSVSVRHLFVQLVTKEHHHFVQVLVFVVNLHHLFSEALKFIVNTTSSCFCFLLESINLFLQL